MKALPAIRKALLAIGVLTIAWASSQAAVPLKTLTSNSIYCLTLSKDTLWVGTAKGLNYTWDRGKHWHGFTTEHGLGKGSTYSITAAYGKVLAATGYEPDDGSNQIGSGLFEHISGEWKQKGFDWKNDNTILKIGYFSAVFDSTLFMAFGGGSILRNGLRTSAGWTIRVPDTSNALEQDYDFAKFPPDTFLAIDQGDTLRFEDSFPGEFAVWALGIDSITTDSCHLYAGTFDGLFMSADKGSTWTAIPLPDSLGRAVYGLWVQEDGTDPSVWFDVGENDYLEQDETQRPAMLRLSLDSHKLSLMENLPGAIALDIDFTGDVAWVATRTGFRKMRGDSVLQEAVEFTRKGLPSKCSAAEAYVDATSGDTIVWVGTIEGVHRSGDAGASWERFAILPEIDPGLKKVYAVPNVINWGQDPVRIVFNLAEDAHVTVRILDWNMNEVAVVMENQWREAGKNQGSGRSNHYQNDRWDGRDQNGHKVPNGVYYVLVQSDKGEKGFAKILVVH